MAIALIVLAIGSVAAGWVAIGGRFHEFLAPSLDTGAHSSISFEIDASAADAADALESTEYTLMAVSTVVAVSGIAIAAFFFLRNRPAAERLAEQMSGVRRVLVRKYYVDEIYDAAVVQPIHIISEQGLWKGVDAGLIDRAVNGVGGLVSRLAEGLRQLQTGSVRAYAASFFGGAVLVLGYYLFR